MKILAFSDVHDNSEVIKKLCRKALKENVDLLLSAGDFGNFGYDLHSALGKFNIGKQILAIPGNHETSEQLMKAEKKFKFLRSIHLKSLIIKDVLFFGCGGALFTPFHTVNEFSEQEFEKFLEKFDSLQRKEAKKFVFVMHQPPYNTKLDMLPEHIGSKSLREFVLKNKPDYAFCGHFHEHMNEEDKINSTIIINPGTLGKIIEI